MLSFLMLTTAGELSSSSKLELVRRLSSAKSEDDVFLALGDLGQAIELFAEEIGWMPHCPLNSFCKRH